MEYVCMVEWDGAWMKKCLFSPKYDVEMIKKFDLTRPGPAQPDHNTRWRLISRQISVVRKKFIRQKKLDLDHKIFVSKFDTDIFNSLAATTSFAKCYFSSFSPIFL